MRLHLRCLATALGLLARPAAAVDSGRPLHHYVHEHWSVREGLPQNSILAADQTRDGYLWFATYEGLARFDGVRFTVFDRSTHSIFTRNAVLALHAREDGDILIGNPGKIVSMRDDRATALVEGAGREQMDTWAILDDRRGRVWIGTRTDGLQVFEHGRIRSVAPEVLGEAHVKSLALTPDGTLWAGTVGHGLFALRDGAPVPCAPCAELPKGSIDVITRRAEGGLWVGGAAGLFRINGSGAFREPFQGHVTAIRDSGTEVWIGTTKGLHRLRDGKVETDPVLRDRNVTVLMVDRERSVWVGTTPDGLYRLREAAFSIAGSAGDDWGEVRLASEIGDKVWATTMKGLVIFDPGGRRSEPGPWPGPDRISELLTVRGATWVGTTAGRLLEFQGGQFVSTRFKPAEGTVTLLQESALGVWVGARDGSLREWTGSRERRTIQIPGRYGVTGVHEWDDGRIMISSHRGLHEWKDGTLTDLTPRLGAPLIVGSGLLADGPSTLWMFTDGNGLIRIRDRTLRPVTTAEGLFDDVVFRVADDGLGFYWMTSNKGIARVSKDELNAVADGRSSRVNPRVFGLDDGLRASECAAGDIARTLDGRLWFPTIDGLAVVDAADLRLNSIRPPVRVEAVKADGVAIAAGGVVPAGAESIEIDYTALSFRVPSKVRFRYQLEGYEDTATDAGGRRTAYYGQVPRGAYRFVVDAVNEDGAASAQSAVFEFSVAPRFHERGAVRLAFVALAAGAIVSLFRFRTRALRERQKTLEAIVAERTLALGVEKERAVEASQAKSRFVASVSHELRTPLNAILGFTEMLRRPALADPVLRREYLDLVATNARHLLGLVNSVLSLTKIEEGHGDASKAPFDATALVQEVISTLRPQAAVKGLRLLVDIESLPQWVSGDAAKVRQILVNLLGNALKFTSSGYVSIHVDRDGDLTRFAVEDSGPGIGADQQETLFKEFSQTDAGVRSGEGTGLGLAISRRLARLLGGDLSLEASSPQGTTFVLSLSLPACDPPLTQVRRRAVGLKAPASLRSILVVDDVPVNRRLLRDLHGILGLSVIEAGNGPDALDLFLRERPSIVWTDAIMPGFGGLELVRRIRQAEKANGWARTPVIAVTASALSDERGDLASGGCDAVILKPFDENEVFGWLEKTLGLQIEYVEEPDRGGAADSSGFARADLDWKGAMETDFVQLEQAIASDDRDALRRSAHDLRGAAAMAGRSALASILADIESQATSNAPAADLRQALARARAELSAAGWER